MSRHATQEKPLEGRPPLLADHDQVGVVFCFFVQDDVSCVATFDRERYGEGISSSNTLD